VVRGALAAVLVALAAPLATVVAAQPVDQQGSRMSGSAAPDRPNTASSGNFAVIQIATTDPDRLTTDWAKSTPGVQVHTSTQAPRNLPIVTFIIFKGCSADPAGNCNVTVDYDMVDPTGKSYDHTVAAPVWVGHPPAPNYNLQLSASGYGIRFEDKDPLGAYLVRATVTDHVAGITLHTEQTLTAVAK
jgi:hypothetical protein